MRAYSAQNMSPRIRSLTILLVIKIAIESQVSAFTLRRAALEPLADLAIAESARAKFNNDLTSNNVKVNDTKNDDISQKLSPEQTTTNTKDIQKLTTNDKTVPTTESVRDETTGTVESNADITTSGSIEITTTLDYTTETAQTSKPTKEVVTQTVDVTTQDITQQTTLQTTTEKNESETKTYDQKPSEPVVDDKTVVIATTTMDSDATTEASDSTTDNKQIEILEGEYSSPTVPPFMKQYTSLDRKRTTNEEIGTNTETENLIKTDTTSSKTILDQVFNTEPEIPSLEELKQQIFSASNVPITTQAAVGAKEHTAILTSIRAGFLDHSNTAATSSDSIFDTGSTVSAPAINAILSQSQLAEDAINEELLKEDVLNNNVNSESLGVERLENNELGKKPNEIYTVAKLPEPAKVTSSSEEKLSVKPINSDKQKNTNFYTVSPNYKPMKKLEFQQPRPFVRDPDDNSWRNESLSSLGIVFKANNSTKPLTQVLKNKTETVMNSTDKIDVKDEALELRERLEKIAEIRKSKKKKIGKDGETIYTDYDSVEITRIPVKEIYVATSAPAERQSQTYTYSAAPPEAETYAPAPPLTSSAPKSLITTYKAVDLTKDQYEMTSPVKIRYDTDNNDDEEIDYISLSNIDLKKFSAPSSSPSPPPTPLKAKPAPPPPPPAYKLTPSRKATIQYFPPRPPARPATHATAPPVRVPTVSFNEYDLNFQRLNEYTTTREPPTAIPVPVYSSSKSVVPDNRLRYSGPPIPVPVSSGTYTPIPVPVETDDPNFGIALLGPNGYNKASYVIKHLRDFINEASKDEEDPRFPPATTTGYTTRPADYFDYEFRRDVLDRFVDNFNQNSERFKVDFPVVYNTSVIHPGGREPASSSAFVKRLYENVVGQTAAEKRCGPSCERTVELAPEYELHYYVPEQEERELRDDVTRRLPPRP